MNGEEFVKLMFKEKSNRLSMYFSESNLTQTGRLIEKIIHQGAEAEDVKKLINLVLNETYYNVLLGLEGEASIGNKQICYRLSDEDNNPITGDGSIEEQAYEMFMKETECQAK